MGWFFVIPLGLLTGILHGAVNTAFGEAGSVFLHVAMIGVTMAALRLKTDSGCVFVCAAALALDAFSRSGISHIWPLMAVFAVTCNFKDNLYIDKAFSLVFLFLCNGVVLYAIGYMLYPLYTQTAFVRFVLINAVAGAAAGSLIHFLLPAAFLNKTARKY